MQKNFFAHESAVIDEPCEIGAGTRIWHFSHIMRDSTVGERCNIGQNVVISPHCRIGNNVKIQNNVSVYTGVILEDDVFCGPSMVFTNVMNPRSEVERKSEYQQTLVRRGATIGANATVVCGVTLGEYSFIGAGAVVTRDVPAFACVYGNPARLQGWMCRCGFKLEMRSLLEGNESAVCECGDYSYLRNGTMVSESHGGDGK
jgi:UDP-2-acetamido-3-amino-2,3-dideoxy-glucuronate N-acetyltransferase